MKVIKKLITFVLLIALLVGGFYTYKGYNMYKEAISEVDINTKVNSIKADSDYTLFDDLPDDYVNAVIAAEDHRFYNHKGVDVISIVRALVADIKAKEIVQGGSTITQQLAKNMYFTQKQVVERKIAELFLTAQLEKEYSKNEILELYVNTSYFGDGYYGIGEASKGYLNKKPKSMNLSECTLLAGIPNAPSVYALSKNRDLAVKRQKTVIEKMVKYKLLSEEKAESLLKELE